MTRNHPTIPFERYADDAICHCRSEAEARALLTRLETRFAECGLAFARRVCQCYLARDPVAGEVPADQDAIRVSSLHGTKGHEFGSVFVIGAVEGVVPLRSAVEAHNVSSEAAVLYVGMTRARDLLYISHSLAEANGKAQSRSSFVDLISPWCDFAQYRTRNKARVAAAG